MQMTLWHHWLKTGGAIQDMQSAYVSTAAVTAGNLVSMWPRECYYIWKPYRRGTIVISSAVVGKAEEITFIGDEDLLKALSLSQVQESKENRFTVTVTDAHSGDSVAEASVTGTARRHSPRKCRCGVQ